MFTANNIKELFTYPRVPFPGPGGLGGFWVGAPVRGAVPVFMFWALTYKKKKIECPLFWSYSEVSKTHTQKNKPYLESE